MRPPLQVLRCEDTNNNNIMYRPRENMLEKKARVEKYSTPAII